MNDRAVYRRKYGIPASWGTAVGSSDGLEIPLRNQVPESVYP